MSGEGPDGKPARLAWWPEVRDRSGERQPLSRTQIVATAIKLIDAEGLEGFSMRRLGQELGAGATSVYWHVKDKDQLIDLVLDRDSPGGRAGPEIQAFPGATAPAALLASSAEC